MELVLYKNKIKKSFTLSTITIWNILFLYQYHIWFFYYILLWINMDRKLTRRVKRLCKLNLITQPLKKITYDVLRSREFYSFCKVFSKTNRLQVGSNNGWKKLDTEVSYFNLNNIKCDVWLCSYISSLLYRLSNSCLNMV